MPGSIHGFKFEDVDADGVYTPGTDQPWGADADNPPVTFELSGGDLALPLSMTIDPAQGDPGDFGFRGLAPGVYTLTELQPIAAHVMPSAPDVDGNGTVDTTVTLIVGSGQELVWQDGAAGDLQPGQEEVNVADDGAQRVAVWQLPQGFDPRLQVRGCGCGRCLHARHGPTLGCRR